MLMATPHERYLRGRSVPALNGRAPFGLSPGSNLKGSPFVYEKRLRVNLWGNWKYNFDVSVTGRVLVQREMESWRAP